MRKIKGGTNKQKLSEIEADSTCLVSEIPHQMLPKLASNLVLRKGPPVNIFLFIQELLHDHVDPRNHVLVCRLCEKKTKYLGVIQSGYLNFRM